MTIEIGLKPFTSPHDYVSQYIALREIARRRGRKTAFTRGGETFAVVLANGQVTTPTPDMLDGYIEADTSLYRTAQATYVRLGKRVCCIERRGVTCVERCERIPSEAVRVKVGELSDRLLTAAEAAEALMTAEDLPAGYYRAGTLVFWSSGTGDLYAWVGGQLSQVPEIPVYAVKLTNELTRTLDPQVRAAVERLVGEGSSEGN